MSGRIEIEAKEFVAKLLDEGRGSETSAKAEAILKSCEGVVLSFPDLRRKVGESDVPDKRVILEVRDRIIANLYTGGDTGLPTEPGSLVFNESGAYKFYPTSAQEAGSDAAVGAEPLAENGPTTSEIEA